MRAERLLDLRAVQAGSSRDSDKVVANLDPEAVRVGDLHDGPPVRSTLVLFAEADFDTGKWHRTSLCVQRDAHDGPVELLAVHWHAEFVTPTAND